VGMLPRALGGFRFLFITIDTFTKWIEAMPMANNTQEIVVKFLQSIIYMFGVSKRVLTDNRTTFKGAKFVRCYADFGIHHQSSSAAHPQINGQVKRANGLILEGMKTIMFHDLEARGIWSYPQCYGPSGPISIEKPEILLSIWSMEQMQCCHHKSILSQQGWHILMQKIRQRQGSSTPICWKKGTTQHWPMYESIKSP
jgi:transposase InsO family protein